MKKVCVLAFAEPPAHWGFKLSRAGTSWWIRITQDRVPACLLALKKRGIDAKALDDEKPEEERPILTVRGKAGEHRPRGRPERNRHDTMRYIRGAETEAEAIAAAAAVWAKRQKRDGNRRKRELKRQRQQQLKREAQARADAIARDFLLNHPQGSA